MSEELSPVPVLPRAETKVVNNLTLPPSKEGGPIATSVLYEDEAVRIWEHRLPAGQASSHHSHEHDYWLMTKHGADGMVVYRQNALVGGSLAGKRGAVVGGRHRPPRTPR